MNAENDPLSRLLHAAARVSRHRCAELPFGFESNVLSGWQQHQMADDWQWVLRFFRRAVVAACAVALISALFSYESRPTMNQNEIAFTDTTIKMTLLP